MMFGKHIGHRMGFPMSARVENDADIGEVHGRRDTPPRINAQSFRAYLAVTSASRIASSA
jgi:hypothetical protein